MVQEEFVLHVIGEENMEIDVKQIIITKTGDFIHITYYKDNFYKFLKTANNYQFIFTDAKIIMENNYIKIIAKKSHNMRRYFYKDRWYNKIDILDIETELKNKTSVKISKTKKVWKFLVGEQNEYIMFNKSFCEVNENDIVENQTLVINDSFFINEAF